MRNKITLFIALGLVVAAALGCGRIWPGSDSNTGNANAQPVAKTGVKECDEFIDVLNEEQKAPDEGFIARKAREFIIDAAKEAIKQNIEQNKNDKEKIALGCKEAKEQFLKDRAKQKTESK